MKHAEMMADLVKQFETSKVVMTEYFNKIEASAKKGETQVCFKDITEAQIQVLKDEGYKVWYDEPDARDGYSDGWVVDWSGK